MIPSLNPTWADWSYAGAVSHKAFGGNDKGERQEG